ncbi:hypothetical protein BIV25_14960 [Streptomyces sp. MUSC 14]|uniref:cytochrome P450 n=1 Tax=Streptomyces sp. MUSC 14 TaxID=1354889 RepID=UPI0008F5C4A7|nr:cytochrome P450 [Streptomyces sp. MUSC 14]OIJ97532.1 hypothetical protein BIV25_14960 [Streptomyces sp. MUSC 14]
MHAREPFAQAHRRTTVEDAQVAGHRVPAGADVVFVSHALHRDPEVFSAPDAFDPDRWLPERVHQAQREGTSGSAPDRASASATLSA